MAKPPPKTPDQKKLKSRSGDPRGQQQRERVKTARRRKNSSARWLDRQLNDPYVAEAQRRGLRSRAAFKLIEINDRFRIFKPGLRAVDLGAAPGGWTQVLIETLQPEKTGARIVAMDLLEMHSLAGATLIQGDFLAPDAPDRLKKELDGAADLVLSDMAHATIGHKQTDHLKIMMLVESAYDFACEVLAPDGVFIAKVFQGGASSELVARAKRDFADVRHFKPKASRDESAETYLIARGFRAGKDQQK